MTVGPSAVDHSWCTASLPWGVITVAGRSCEFPASCWDWVQFSVLGSAAVTMDSALVAADPPAGDSDRKFDMPVVGVPEVARCWERKRPDRPGAKPVLMDR